MASSRLLLPRDLLPALDRLLGVVRPERGAGRSSFGAMCKEEERLTEESRLESHDWPLFSREDSVRARPVCTSQEEEESASVWRCRREEGEERGWVGLRMWLELKPKP